MSESSINWWSTPDDAPQGELFNVVVTDRAGNVVFIEQVTTPDPRAAIVDVAEQIQGGLL